MPEGIGYPSKGKKASKRKVSLDQETRLRGMVQDAIKFHESEYAPFRLKAGRYYRGEPFQGDGEDGRSKVVLTELRDAVLQQMPSLMRVFFGPDGAVEFVARRADAVDLAEQQTDYINYIFNEDNPGFLVAYSAFKDALVRRIGIVKWWWEKTDEVEARRITVTEEGLEAILTAEPDWEVEDDNRTVGEDGMLSVSIRRKLERGRVRVEAVPPEEFVYNRSARSLEDAILVAHVTEKTVGELIAMGYDADRVRKAGQSGRLPQSIEAAARHPRNTDNDEAAMGENAPVAYVEAYVKDDWGDGLELRKVCLIGAGLEIVNDEPALEVPFAIFTPDPEPHEVQGLGLSDQTLDLQEINSHIARGMLDSLNLSLHPRTGYVDGAVNVKDLMNVEIGAVIRMTDPNAIRPIEHRFVGADALGVLEYFRSVKEERLGTTRASAGLAPDALQSSTAQAVEATMAKAESRTELMARVFAETGMKRLFRGLYNLVIRHQDYPRLVRMRGAYVEVDPTNWPADPDVSVRVGIGAGTRNEQLQSIAAIIAKQEMVLQTLGLSDNPLVDLRQYRNALAEAVKLSGRQDPSRFWKEITPEDLEAREQQAQQAAQEQGQNDPALVLAQAQVEQEKLKNQIDQLKLQIEHQHKSASLELQREQMIRLDDRERDRMEADIALRAREIELKYQGAVDVASIKAEMERDRETLRAETALANTALGLPEEQALEQEPLQEDVPTDFPSDGAIL